MCEQMSDVDFVVVVKPVPNCGMLIVEDKVAKPFFPERFVNSWATAEM